MACLRPSGRGVGGQGRPRRGATGRVRAVVVGPRGGSLARLLLERAQCRAQRGRGGHRGRAESRSSQGDRWFSGLFPTGPTRATRWSRVASGTTPGCTTASSSWPRSICSTGRSRRGGRRRTWSCSRVPSAAPGRPPRGPRCLTGDKGYPGACGAARTPRWRVSGPTRPTGLSGRSHWSRTPALLRVGSDLSRVRQEPAAALRRRSTCKWPGMAVPVSRRDGPETALFGLVWPND